jgi:hypothetical protein
MQEGIDNADPDKEEKFTYGFVEQARATSLQSAASAHSSCIRMIIESIIRSMGGKY